MDSNEKMYSIILGLAVLGCLITGVLGIMSAIGFGIDGIGLIGSGIAFGSLTIALYRK